MHRFFLEAEDVVEQETILIKHLESVNHLVRVLRVKIGEPIEIVTPDKTLIAKITAFDTSEVILSIEKSYGHENESKIPIDLFQGLPKGPKLELILQKNVELGVNTFYLVQSKRCIVDYKPKDVSKKIERLEKVVKEAAKQSKRDIVPTVKGILNITDVVKMIETYDLFLVLYEKEDTQSLKHYIHGFTGNRIAIFIGPEGGFEPAEIDKLESSGAKIATLGKRILRTETAGFVAVACAQYDLGELG